MPSSALEDLPSLVADLRAAFPAECDDGWSKDAMQDFDYERVVDTLEAAAGGCSWHPLADELGRMAADMREIFLSGEEWDMEAVYNFDYEHLADLLERAGEHRTLPRGRPQ